MLMRCIDEGGIPVRRDTERDERAVRMEDERNPHGYYEPPQGLILGQKWPFNLDDDQAIKVWAGIVDIFDDGGEWRVAVLHRSFKAIAASRASNTRTPIPFTADFHEQSMTNALHKLHANESVVSVTELHYDAIIENPRDELSKLVEDGWPLDLVAACQVPDGALRHHGH